MPTDLSIQLAALLASGGNISDPPPPAPKTPDPALENEEEEEEETPASPEPETNDDPEPNPPAPEAKDTGSQSLIDLATKLGSANAKLEEANAKIEDFKSQLAKENETSAKASEVIRLAVERLGVVLNSPVPGISAMSLSALCEKFDAMNAEFTARFTPGQKSNPPAVVPKGTTNAEKARYRSTKPTPTSR